MARITTYRCDVCGDASEEEKFTKFYFADPVRSSKGIELCEECAKIAVGKAFAAGLLDTKPPCVVCGGTGKLFSKHRNLAITTSIDCPVCRPPAEVTPEHPHPGS